MHAALLQEAAPETPSLDQSLQLLEFWRAGALQPFEQDHLAVDNVGPRLQQAGYGELTLEREPMASATTKASKPCASRSIAV